MDFLLIVAKHLSSLIKCRPFGRWLLVCRLDEGGSAGGRGALVESWDLVAHTGTISFLSFIRALFDRLDIDELGIVMTARIYSSVSLHVLLCSWFERDVRWWPVRLETIVGYLVIPSLSLHDILLKFGQTILVFVVHQASSE